MQLITGLCILSHKDAFYPCFTLILPEKTKIAMYNYHIKHCIMKKTWILLTAIVLVIVGLILNFTVGNQFSSGDFCLNYFAAGDFACGVFAAGKFSCGIFSIGIFSIGVFSLGIFNIGLYVIGFFLIGLKKNFGYWHTKKMDKLNAQ
jgi:hypothetical protein